MNKLSAAVALVVCGLSVNAFAGARVVVNGVIPGTVPAQDQGIRSLNSSSSQAQPKKILFQKVVLSADAQAYLANHISDPDSSSVLLAAPAGGVSSQQIAMNSVPVLDQGQHGSCATFATTAALDAVIGKKDYISQLCNLELGSYLESQDANYPSGWEGSTNEIILTQVKENGIIKKADQTSVGCRFDNKPEQYNLTDQSATGLPVTKALFTAHSEMVMSNISYVSLFNPDDAFSNKVNMTNVLNNKIKPAINKGHRIVFGTLIDEKIGGNGLGGSYKALNDTWALTATIQRHARNKNNIHAGHAMIITGYDDNAVMTDTDGKKHTGILTLRNSWGAQYGDQGNYYMTYDYFKKLVTEAEEIVPSA